MLRVSDPTRELPLYDGLENRDLLKAIRRDCKHNSLGYQNARKLIFTKIDNHDGAVRDVYTGRVVRTNSIPSSSNMNLEHTWPQSLGPGGTFVSDLHHLYPVDAQANTVRGNLPLPLRDELINNNFAAAEIDVPIALLDEDGVAWAGDFGRGGIVGPGGGVAPLDGTDVGPGDEEGGSDPGFERFHRQPDEVRSRWAGHVVSSTLRRNNQARIFVTTSPCTSVSRKSRPAWR